MLQYPYPTMQTPRPNLSTTSEMTTTTPRTLSLSVPCTQNTAPILEFRCLYTHDIRRKSKRWQDGFLRFHTFNKRVMVYDLPRNFVGDSHWRETNDLTDGDEFELERHGILVQVGEALGRTEQDLSVLFEKKVREREQRLQRADQSRTPLRRSAGPARAFSPPLGRTPNPPHTHSRTLSDILQTPARNTAQATWPGKSPFEQLRANDGGAPRERSSKKRKTREEDVPLSTIPVTERRIEVQEQPTRKKPRRKAVRTNGGLGSIVIVDVSDDDQRVSHEQANTSAEQVEKPKEVTTEVQAVTNPRAHELLQKAANPLRLAGRPARKKLLCQDLSSPTRPTTLTLRATNNAPPRPQRNSSSPPPSDRLNQFQQAQTQRLHARLARHGERSKEPAPHEQERDKAPGPNRLHAVGKPQAAGKQPEIPHGRNPPPRVNHHRPPQPPQPRQQQQQSRPNSLNTSLPAKQKAIPQRPVIQRPQPQLLSRQGSMNKTSHQQAAAGPIGAWSIEISDLLNCPRPPITT
ncbi:MAG: hypothetical protein M1816_007609 [Peltula sp. TS41687]|nr:MAG: hypothetical protein M1816_007609 [Peltula sp. TS41687]